MIETSLPTEAELIALKKMFKAIADYGKKMRLCRHIEDDFRIRDIPDVITLDQNKQIAQIRQKRRRREKM